MSEIKVNKISPRTNCGTTTLGDSGDTFTIPAGVSITNNGTASGFGATGSASWNTTVKTGDFTAVAGEGYFVDTTSQEIDVTLPAGTAGAVIAVKDYAGTWDTNNCILVANGSDKIGGSTNNATLSTEGLAVTLVFIDSTQGWLVTDDGLQSQAVTNPYMIATGGTITTIGNFKVHAFTGPGSFEVTKAASSASDNKVDYLVVAGGGAGTCNGGGGAGAGGFRLGSCEPGKPGLAAAGHPVSVQTYPVSVGGGGAYSPNCTANPPGTDSSFSTFTAAGGGGAGLASGIPGAGPGVNGGSGGGGAGNSRGGPGGSGNTPPVSPSQGNDGGDQSTSPNARAGGSGGGGAAAAGADKSGNASSPGPLSDGGAAGAGAPVTAVFGTAPQPFYPVPGPGEGYFAGGGGGGMSNDAGYTSPAGGAGGIGGGGPGGPNNSAAGAAIVNSGGGGGSSPTGGGSPSANSNGGSGIVLIRYRFQ